MILVVGWHPQIPSSVISCLSLSHTFKAQALQGWHGEETTEGRERGAWFLVPHSSGARTIGKWLRVCFLLENHPGKKPRARAMERFMTLGLCTDLRVKTPPGDDRAYSILFLCSYHSNNMFGLTLLFSCPQAWKAACISRPGLQLPALSSPSSVTPLWRTSQTTPSCLRAGPPCEAASQSRQASSQLSLFPGTEHSGIKMP